MYPATLVIVTRRRYGADLRVRDGKGKTALDYARERVAKGQGGQDARLVLTMLQQAERHP